MKHILTPSLFLLAACSGPVDEAAPPSETTSTAEALSNHEHCDSIAPDRDIDVSTILNRGVAFSSPATYDHSACRHSYVVDVDVPSDLGGSFSIVWGGAKPTTQDACERARILVYGYVENQYKNPAAGGVGYVSDTAYGVWTGQGTCQIPMLSYSNLIVGSPPLTPGPNTTWQFAVESLQGFSDGSTQQRFSNFTVFGSNFGFVQ